MSWHKGKRPSSRQWGRVRLLVFDRDNWTCMKCGKAGRLECDHRTPLEDGGELYAMGNLQTLCRSCHIDKTSGERSGQETPPGVLEWRRYLTNGSVSI